jgi:hypothetical protein
VRRLLFAFGIVGVAVGSSCNCSGNGCKIDKDCATNQICVNDVCQSGFRTGDGGYVLTDAGNGGDGGQRTLPDGGPCTNLQCQIVSCPTGQSTTLTGQVFDPSGTLPLYNAVVYVPNATVDPLTTGATCDTCGSSVSGQPVAITLTDYTGSFSLTNVPAGANIPLVIQIGKWRRQVTVPNVPQCTSTGVAATLTRMPRTWSGHGGEGDIPHIAISSGSADPFECLLLKMGIGAEIKEAGQGGRIEYFVENGVPMSNNTPPGSQLYSSLGTLNSYDIVILPCEGAANAKSAQAEQNLVDYTADGGRVFTTHYGYEWLAPGWGAQPFPTTASWCPANGGTCPTTSTNNSPDPVKVAINTGFPKAMAFSQWLGTPQVNALTGGLFSISAPRYDIGKVNAAAPAYVVPSAAWMFGDPHANWVTGQSTYAWTPHMTFNTPYNPPNLPDGDAGIQCGRLVYSDFHVTANDQQQQCQNAGGNCTFPTECIAGQPYDAQEKALVFMLFDLSSCIQSDQIAPSTCTGANGSCTQNSQCCQGLSCTSGTGGTCAGELGCLCQALIQ